MGSIQYRYELKYALNKADAALLKKQLAMVCRPDPHSVSDEYSYDIRSLYFDDAMNSAFNDKVNGEMFRKKYRIRIYNNSTDVIKLECKHKDFTGTYKQSQTISLDTCKKLMNKEYYLIEPDGVLLEQFLVDARLFALRPAVVVDYRRLAFIYPVSEVRITFDENIRSGRYSLNFLDDDIQTFPVHEDSFTELEVKCNDFIPDHILSVINSINKNRIAMSKFALSYQLK